ncbi:MAG: ATP-binding cassette domain-containing protein, partial [Candidatus Eisenbacteria sp.]|nr:ATP-binding cassette domain-containing protein [Candidatus Eisenbacteria bacterium]
MNSSTAIEIQSLSVSFRDQDVLSGVSATLASRQITVLIGPSGSGKTTLLRAINRLNEFFPGSRTRGTVRLQLSQGWVDAYRDAFPLVSLRRQAAMVFQNPNLLPGSIRRNFATPLAAVLGLSRTEIETRMVGALEE